MAVVLVKFGVILVVVVMGFAVSFFALFRDVETFDETLLYLFKAILGDVALFDEFDESYREPYADVGRFLLAIFVFIVTIMLLNLLIAILSTAHADVHSNTEREFKVSTARTVQYYRLVVELDIQPAPFNVIQSFVTVPFIATGRRQSDSCRRVKRAVGHVAFWLTLGPIAVLAGTALWVASIPRIFALLHNERGRTSLKELRAAYCYFPAFVLGAPICLVVMWLKVPFVWMTRISDRVSRRPSLTTNETPMDVDVQEMLREFGASASQLRKYLGNPMIDPHVQRDEVDRGTTVRHIKLLRDRLEKTLRDEIKDKFKISDRSVSELRDEIKETIDGRVSELRDEINEKFVKIMEILEASHNSATRGGL